MGGTAKNSEPPKKDDGGAKKSPPPARIEDDDCENGDFEDGDMATPKRDLDDDDDRPL